MSTLAEAEEVVDVRGGRADPDLSLKKKKGHNQLTIAFHLTSYAFIADKLHKNPYIARYILIALLERLLY